MQELLGLFTYHRDATRVARALGTSLEELTSELEDLGIRRKAFRLMRGTDLELPRAAAVPGAASVPVRRRRASAAATSPAGAARPGETEPQARHEAPQTTALKAVLAEAGPRRAMLAERLGIPVAALPALLRGAGLEREFALRERDLIRGLWSKHGASEAQVASELGIARARLRQIIRERGLARELDAARDRLRRAARSRRWPSDRIAMLLEREQELRDLDLYDEIRAEVGARVAVLWKTLQGRPQALLLLRKKLHLTDEQLQRLRTLLQLR